EGPVAHQESARALARPGTAAYSFASPEGGTMIRPLLTALVLCTGFPAAAESLHLAPIGTVVSGSFDLAGKTIPLPEGNFALAAVGAIQPTMFDGSIATPLPKVVRVFLAEIKPPRLRATVWASAPLKPTSYRFNWLGEPCKKE